MNIIKIPHPPYPPMPPHHHHQKEVGGCKGTRYGCCSDGVTPKGGPGFLC